MIEDLTHLEVLKSLASELQDNLIHYNRLVNGETDKATLLAVRLRQIIELREILRKQERHLRFMNGEPIEPETHYIEAIIVGTGSSESAM